MVFGWFVLVDIRSNKEGRGSERGEGVGIEIRCPMLKQSVFPLEDESKPNLCVKKNYCSHHGPSDLYVWKKTKGVCV